MSLDNKIAELEIKLEWAFARIERLESHHSWNGRPVELDTDRAKRIAVLNLSTKGN